MEKPIPFKINLTIFILSLFLCTEVCFSLPQPQEVVSGSVDFQYPDSTTLQINSSDKAIINYSSFDIAESESVIVNLPSVDNEILNRVLGNKATEILGKLTCNGIFILINQKGIYFGANSQVDVASLIASTRDITNSDFLDSKYVFGKLSQEQLSTLLRNQGNISIRKAGFGVLIAGAIENSGTIIAPLGTIAMAGGDMVTLDIAGNGLISIAIDKPTANKVYDLKGKPITDQIKNTGTLQADGGVVLLKAEALPGLFEKAINLEGYVKADKLTVVADRLSLTSEALLTEVYKQGDISLTHSTQEDNLITLEGEGIKLTYLKTNNLTLQADNSINTTPGLIIPANQLKLIAQQFGTQEVPLTLEANLTYIKRLSGNIEILESLGLGTSIMLRGPPDLFGAIIYNQSTQLVTLEAQNIIFNGNLTLFNDLAIEGNLLVYSGEIKANPDSLLITVKGDLSFSGNGYTYFGASSLLQDTKLRVNLHGNLIVNNPNLWSYADINLVGEKNQNIDYLQGTLYGAITLNKPSGTVNYGSLDLNQLPLYFVQNRGQVSSEEVKFYISTPENLVYFTPCSVLYLNISTDTETNSTTFTVTKLNFLNANTNLQIIPQLNSGASFNYFLGNDPNQYQTNIPSYFKLIYQELYPGIDLIYSSKQGDLESEFIIKPNFNYEDIRLMYEGIQGLSLDTEGNLIIQTPAGELKETKPYAYQTTEQGTQVVLASFLLLSSDTYGFKLEGYNPNYSLIIDPSLSYSTYIGGSGNDNTNSIAIDSSGNAYIVGLTYSSDFPTTSGAYDTALSGTYDAFVTKLNSTGTGLIYSTYLGGSGNDLVSGITLDSSGNAYLLGQTSSSNFPTTTGAYDTDFNGTADIFVTLLNSSGTGLTYSTYLGGSGSDAPAGRIPIDSSGNAYIAGWTGSSNFPTTTGAYDTDFNGGTWDVFLAVLNSSGTGLTYSTYLGGSQDELGLCSAIDSSGNVYITGPVFSSDFPTTSGAYDTSLGGSASIADVFVVKINPAGGGSNDLVYSTYLGGSDDDRLPNFAIDSSGNIYIMGRTLSSDFPTTTGAYDTSLGGTQDAFVAKLNPGGNGANDLIYSTYLGGSNKELRNSITLDSSGNAYLLGQTASSDFPTTSGAYDTSYNVGGTNGWDVFLTVLNSLGTGLLYSTYLGGTADDNGTHIVLDSSKNAYISGTTYSSDFPTTTGAYDTSLGGTYDGFVCKFTPSLSGTIYTNEAKTTNVGSGVTVGLSVQGGTKDTAITNSDGYFSFFEAVHNANDTILLFIDGSGSYEANLISQALDSTSTISGLELYTSKIVLRHESAGPLTNSLLATADNSGDDDIHYTISGSAVTFESGYELWIESGKTYTPGGSVSLADLDLNGTFSPEANAVNVSGNWDATGGVFTAGSSTVTFNGGGTSLLTSGGTTENFDFSTITITNSTTLRPQTNGLKAATLNISSGTLDIATNDLSLEVTGTLTVSSSQSYSTGTGTQTIGTLTNNGNITCESDGTNLSITTLTNNDGSLWIYTATSGTPNIKQATYHDLTLNDSNGSAVYTLGSGTTTVTGTLTITGGTLAIGSNTLNVTESLLNSDTLTISGGTLDVDSNITVGSLTCSGAANINIAGNWSGVTDFTASSSTITFDGGSSQTLDSGAKAFNNLEHSGSATLQLSNNPLTVGGTFTNSAGTFNANGLATTVTGLATVSGGSYSASTATQIFNAGLTISGGTFTGSTGTVDVTDLTLSSGTLTAPSGSLFISGNFNHSAGTFTHNSGTVTFDGSGTSSISGSSTFYNLTSTTSGKQLSFQSGSTQTVSGTLTLTGSSGSLILLRSSSTPTQWNINPQGTINVSYVNVKDSYNRNGQNIDPANSLDSGNNTYWFSLAAPKVEQATKATDTATPVVEMAIAPETETPVSEGISIGSQEELVSQEEAAQDYGFNYTLVYEEEEKKYKKRYLAGKYRTVVIVFAGRVVVSPYDEKGIKEEQTISLNAGQKTSRVGEVK